LELFAITSMGPECNYEIVEATEDKCVTRTNACPWHARWKELGLGFDFCGLGHQGWADWVIESLNRNFTLALPRICFVETNSVGG
jgi:hypothetical protein